MTSGKNWDDGECAEMPASAQPSELARGRVHGHALAAFLSAHPVCT